MECPKFRSEVGAGEMMPRWLRAYTVPAEDPQKAVHNCTHSTHTQTHTHKKLKNLPKIIVSL